MNEAAFDFERIGTMDDFYAMAKTSLQLPAHFGKNLDALWDCITGDMPLPATVRFLNMSMTQLETFDKLILLFEDAADELEPDFGFEYYLRKPG
ncbi:barstar family protein [Niabella insulamsoli]|uniref:barstar family protein n=1 Tax=Niabella insulamsoli TaxID=3144874 RepID=UPI0031FE2FEE